MACSIFVLYYRANARKGSTWNLRNTFYPYFNTILSKWESKIRKSHKYSLSKQKLSAITTKTSVKWQHNTPCRTTVISKHLNLKDKATPRPSSIYVLLSLQVQKSQNSKTKHVTYCCQGRDSLPHDLLLSVLTCNNKRVTTMIVSTMIVHDWPTPSVARSARCLWRL